MALGRPRRSGDPTHPGEPGVGIDLAPPFVAEDEATRWLFSLNRFGIRPGLQRIRGLLDDLGNPEQDLQTIVTAGTNGKGSTTRVLACLLQAAGHKVLTYTSPHLLRVYERISIDDHPVSGEDFAARVAVIRPLVEKHEASWFETLTALAIQIARDEQVDIVCCEVGLGGRLDATNALPSIATLLTTVGLDHQHILGESLELIAAEKLGLLKPGVPLFCGVDESLRGQVFRQAVIVGCPAYFLDELGNWGLNPAGDRLPGGTWELALRDRVYSGLPESGTGALRRNTALALLALTELENSGRFGLLPTDVPSALRNLFLPGRYQTVLTEPDWIFDTAHNAQALDQAVGEFLAGTVPGRRAVLFGAMHDKGLSPNMGSLLRRCDKVLGAPVSLPRSRSVAELGELFELWKLDPGIWTNSTTASASGCTVAPTLDTALRHLARWCREGDRVLVTGSCFMVAEVLHRLGFTDLADTRQPVPAAKVLGGLVETSG